MLLAVPRTASKATFRAISLLQRDRVAARESWRWLPELQVSIGGGDSSAATSGGRAAGRAARRQRQRRRPALDDDGELERVVMALIRPLLHPDSIEDDDETQSDDGGAGAGGDPGDASCAPSAAAVALLDLLPTALAAMRAAGAAQRVLRRVLEASWVARAAGRFVAIFAEMPPALHLSVPQQVLLRRKILTLAAANPKRVDHAALLKGMLHFVAAEAAASAAVGAPQTRRGGAAAAAAAAGAGVASPHAPPAWSDAVRRLLQLLPTAGVDGAAWAMAAFLLEINLRRVPALGRALVDAVAAQIARERCVAPRSASQWPPPLAWHDVALLTTLSVHGSNAAGTFFSSGQLNLASFVAIDPQHDAFKREVAALIDDAVLHIVRVPRPAPPARLPRAAVVSAPAAESSSSSSSSSSAAAGAAAAGDAAAAAQGEGPSELSAGPLGCLLRDYVTLGCGEDAAQQPPPHAPFVLELATHWMLRASPRATRPLAALAGAESDAAARSPPALSRNEVLGAAGELALLHLFAATPASRPDVFGVALAAISGGFARGGGSGGGGGGFSRASAAVLGSAATEGRRSDGRGRRRGRGQGGAASDIDGGDAISSSERVSLIHLPLHCMRSLLTI